MHQAMRGLAGPVFLNTLSILMEKFEILYQEMAFEDFRVFQQLSSTHPGAEIMRGGIHILRHRLNRSCLIHSLPLLEANPTNRLSKFFSILLPAIQRNTEANPYSPPALKGTIADGQGRP